MGYTIFFHPQVTPKIIQVQVDIERWVEAVYDPNSDPENPVILEPAHMEPTYGFEDQLNPVPPPVYPSTFGKQIWGCRTMDYYSDDPKVRAELWEDSVGTATYAEVVAVFPELPLYTELAARKWGAAQLGALVNPYMNAERETWHVQQREAEAWQADQNGSVPLITALASARGLTVAELVAKIMQNVNAFRIASGTILGRQQALIDAAYQATDLASLLSICDSIGIKLMEV